jgi:hypothetical protein
MLIALDGRPILVRVDRVPKLLAKRLVPLRSHRARSGIHRIRRLVAEGLAGLGLDLRFELVDGALTGGRGGAAIRTTNVNTMSDRPALSVRDVLGDLASKGLTGDGRVGLGRIRLERLLGCGQNEVRCEILCGRKHVAGRDLPTSVLDFWKDMLIEADCVMG